MSNPLFNKFGGMTHQNNYNGNILSQIAQVKRNPGAILDILLQNGKINQQQYGELQPYKKDPQAIFQYLLNNGKQSELHDAEQVINQLMH